MRAAKVYYKNEPAGILSENELGYEFRYNESYLQNEAAKPISMTLPLQQLPYQSKILFPFFDGLIPEGWLLDIAVTNWKINQQIGRAHV